MKFVVFAQLPPALGVLLLEQGHEAWHVRDLAMQDADDTVIWNYALEEAAIIVTKDEDFPHRLSQSPRGPGVVWLRIGNTRRRELLEWFAELLLQVEACLERGDLLVEVR